MSNQKRFALIGVGTQLEEAGAGVIGDLAAFTDPNDDRLFGWDDSASAAIGFDLGAGLITSGTNVLLDSAIFTSVTTAQLTMAATEIELNGSIDINGLVDISLDTLIHGDLSVASFTPIIRFVDVNASADEARWVFANIEGLFVIQTRFDNEVVGTNAVAIDRTDATVDEIELNATALDFNGNADISGTLVVGSTLTVSAQLFIASTDPILFLRDTNAPANETYWIVRNTGGDFYIQAFDDILSGSSSPLIMTRTGTTVDVVQFNTTTFDVNASADISGALTVGSTLTVNGSNTFLSSAQPNLWFTETGATTNNKTWRFVASSEALLAGVANDALDAFSYWLVVNRTTTTVDEVELNATLLDFNGQIRVSGTSNPLQIMGADVTGDNYISFYRSNESTRKGYFGFGNSADDTFHWTNEEAASIAVGVQSGQTIRFSCDNFSTFPLTLSSSGADVVGSVTATSTILTTGQVVQISSTSNQYFIAYQSDGSTDNKRAALVGSAGDVFLQIINDAFDNAVNAISVLRTGMTVDEVDLTATALDFNGNADISGTLVVNGNFTLNASMFVDGANPAIFLRESGVTADNKNWLLEAQAENFNLYAYNDAASVFTLAMQVQRTGTTIDEIELNATALDFNGNADISGTLVLGNYAEGVIELGTSGTLAINRSYKYKTADTSRASTSTLADDAHLAGWSLAASSYYLVEGYLEFFSTSVTPDAKFAFQISSAETDGGFQGLFVDSATVTANSGTITTENFVSLAANTVRTVTFRGFVLTNAAATLDFQWAQNTSDATETLLRRGSWIRVLKLGT